MEEIWKPVLGYEGIYEISNLGRLKSLPRIKSGRARSRRYTFVTKEKILKQTIDNKGYLRVNLYKDGVKKTKFIHQMVCESFFSHTPCGHNLVVNHINADKSDNRLINLEVITPKQNAGQAHGVLPKKRKGVRWCSVLGAWKAFYILGDEEVVLGVYDTEICAAKTYADYLRQHVSALV